MTPCTLIRISSVLACEDPLYPPNPSIILPLGIFPLNHSIISLSSALNFQSNFAASASISSPNSIPASSLYPVALFICFSFPV